jgi:hypothetical protein
VGLDRDQGQVLGTLLAMLAHALLAVVTAAERRKRRDPTA